MRLDTVFDVASLTKILAVWSTIGTLIEEGKLQLHTPLGTFWDEVAGHPLAQATAHHLLTHTAGLPLRANLRNLYGTDPQDIRAGVLHEALHRPPGEAVEYTDRAALVLDDLALFLRHMLAPTQSAFGPTWIRESLRIHTGGITPARGIFWHPAPGTDPDPDQDIWVHCGFTGTGMWISPAQGRWAALLTNKLRFNRDREPLTEIRNDFRGAAFAPEHTQGT